MGNCRRWLALGALLASSCSDLPGDVVGTYKVEMKLEENTCGMIAIHSLDGRTYSAQLRRDANHGYWRVPGQAPHRGLYEPPEFRFEYSSVVAGSGPDAGPQGCRLVQKDVLSGTVTGDESEHAEDAGADADQAEVEDEPPAESEQSAHGAEGLAEHTQADAGPILVGTHEMTISAAGDCREALMPKGAFERLPCVVRYELRGGHTKPF